MEAQIQCKDCSPIDEHSEKVNRPMKSRRKQDRPRRIEEHNDVPSNEKRQENEGYLSDEYGEPSKLTDAELQTLSQRLKQIEEDDEQQSLIEHLRQHQKTSSHHFHADENDERQRLIDEIVPRIVSICSSRNCWKLLETIPMEIRMQVNNCSLTNVPSDKTKTSKRRKRVANSTTTAKATPMANANSSKRTSGHSLSTAHSSSCDSVGLRWDAAQPSSLTGKQRQSSQAQDKQADLYEVIHCVCSSQVDNGFMIQVKEDVYEATTRDGAAFDGMTSFSSLCVFSVKNVCVGLIVNVWK